MKNKKAVGFVYEFIIAAVLGLIVLGLMGYGPLSGISKGSSEIANKANCGSVLGSIGQGTCKSECSPGEDTYEGFGCEKYTPPQKCCLAIGSGRTVSVQGGNSDYNFEAMYADLAPNQNTCTKISGTSAWQYSCKSGSVKLKIGVRNLGKYDLDISANPRVLQDNSESYPAFSQPVKVKPGNIQDIYVDIIVKNGATYKINPAGKCLSQICTQTFGSAGIFRINEQNQIVIVGNN